MPDTRELIEAAESLLKDPLELRSGVAIARRAEQMQALVGRISLNPAQFIPKAESLGIDRFNFERTTEAGLILQQDTSPLWSGIDAGSGVAIRPRLHFNRHEFMFGGPRIEWVGEAGPIHVPGPAPTLPTKTALAAPPAVDPELAEHARIARKLGLAKLPAEVVDAELRQALIELGITCYELGAVQEYLDQVCARKNDEDRSAGWAGASYAWRWYGVRMGDTQAATKLGHGVSDQYAEEIPLPVAMTMDQIAERTNPDNVTFLVAAVTRYPDPFLGVQAKGGTEIFIVERWDEPGFRGVKA
jgi:hypothetical protein